MFLLTPYLWVDLYVRGDLSELTALLVCPWPIYFLLAVADRVRAGRRVDAAVLGLASSVALIVVSHPAVALFCVPVVSLLAGWHGLARDLRWRYYLPVAAGLVVALSVSAPYWFTVFQLRSAVSLDRATIGSLQPYFHVVEPWQLVSRAWGFGASVPGPRDRMSFQLGGVHLVVATAGAILGRRSRIVQASFCTYVALVVMMTRFGTWPWLHIGLLKPVQFPWRVLSVTASLQVACMAGLGTLATVPVLGRRLGLVLAALVLLGVAWHRNQLAIHRPLDASAMMIASRAEVLTTKKNFADANEFLPKTVRKPGALVPRRGDIPIVEALGEARVEPLEGNTPYRIRYLVVSPEPVDVRINQLYFPGWRVLVDGRDVGSAALEAKLPDDGRILVALPPAAHRLDAFYDGPPGWRVRDGAIGLVLVLLAVLRTVVGASRSS